MASFNDQIIEEFRANEGRVGGMFEGAPMLLLTTTGAKSGEPRVSPLVHSGSAGGDGYAIAASKAGAPTRTRPGFRTSSRSGRARRGRHARRSAPGRGSRKARSATACGKRTSRPCRTSATTRRPPRGSSRWWCSSASSGGAAQATRAVRPPT